MKIHSKKVYKHSGLPINDFFQLKRKKAKTTTTTNKNASYAIWQQENVKDPVPNKHQFSLGHAKKELAFFTPSLP